MYVNVVPSAWFAGTAAIENVADEVSLTVTTALLPKIVFILLGSVRFNLKF